MTRSLYLFSTPPLRRALVAGTLALALGGSLPLGAVAPENAAEEKDTSSEPLRLLVTELSSRDNLSARDYAEFAQTTLNYGERQKSSQKPLVESAIRDALIAVENGGRLDPRAADWKKLRADLEKLLEKAPPPQPEQKQPPKPEEKKSEDQDPNPPSEKQQSQGGAQEKSEAGVATPSQQEKAPEKDESDAGQKQQQAPQEMNLFKDMKAEKPKEATPPQQLQVVGGKEDQKSDMKSVNPELILPLQRLEEVRRGDSPAQLHDKLRRNSQTPPKTKKDW